jgi:general secretion pathway protein N
MTWRRTLGLPLIGSAMLLVIKTSATGVASGTPTRMAALDPGVTIETHAPPPTPPRAPSPAPSAASANPLAAIALALLPTTRERPLFSPSRRTPPPPVMAAAAPVVAAAPSPPPKPQRPDLSLVGTIIGQPVGIGLFVETGTTNVVRLRTGESHDGWRLSAVTSNKATLANDGTTAVLALPRPGTEQDEAVTSPYARGTRRVHH